MKKRTTTYFNGKQFLSLLISSSITMIVSYVMVLSDSIIAGQFLGEDALSAVLLVTPLFTLIAFCGTILCMGTSTGYSFYMGRFEKDRANQFYGQGCILSVGIGLILCILFAVFSNLYFTSLSVNGVVMEYAKEYFRAYPLLALLYPPFLVIGEMIYADGDENCNTLSYGVNIITNLFSSLLLCRFFGIAGIGYGSLLGVIAGMLIFLFHFLSKRNSLCFVWHLSGKDIWFVAQNGVTDGEQYLCVALLEFVLNWFFILKFGSRFLPVLSAIINTVSMTIIFDGIGQAIGPIINVARGEKNSPAIEKMMKFATVAAILEGIVFMLLLLLFAEPVVWILGIRDSEVALAAARAVRLISLTFAALSLEYLYSSYYLYIQKIRLSIWMTAVGNLFAPVLWVIILTPFLGIDGLAVAFSLAPVLALLSVAGVVFQKGKKTFPLMLSDNGKHILNQDFWMNQDSLQKLMENVRIFLEQRQIEKQTIMYVQLILEEYYNTILDYNEKKKLMLSVSVIVGEKIEIILRDNGKIFDITNAERSIKSLSDYVLSCLQKKTENHNLTTLGVNRNRFELTK